MRNRFFCGVVKAFLFRFSLETIKQFRVLGLCCPGPFFLLHVVNEAKKQNASETSVCECFLALFVDVQSLHVLMRSVPDGDVFSASCQCALCKLMAHSNNSAVCIHSCDLTRLQLCADALQHSAKCLLIQLNTHQIFGRLVFQESEAQFFRGTGSQIKF